MWSSEKQKVSQRQLIIVEVSKEVKPANNQKDLKNRLFEHTTLYGIKYKALHTCCLIAFRLKEMCKNAKPR